MEKWLPPDLNRAFKSWKGFVLTFRRGSLIIHHLPALRETHGQYNHTLNISQGFCKTLLFYLYSLNFIQIKLWILTFNVWALFFELYSTYIWILD